MARCARCGRKLRDALSVAVGLGPECRKIRKPQPQKSKGQASLPPVASPTPEQEPSE